MIALLLLIGVAAGILTTVAGLGGGMILVLVLSLVWGPTAALASTAPALLLGNLHRLYLFRSRVDGRIAAAFACGALPGSVAGGALMIALPERALQGVMVVMTAIAVARAIRGDRPRSNVAPPRRRAMLAALAPAGFGIGSLAATSGGVGLLAGPVLMAAGLTGEAYVATGAAVSATMHVGRLIAYGAGGLFSKEIVSYAAILAAAILSGNLIGKRLRRRIEQKHTLRIEIGALVACVALALVGLGR